MRKIKTNNNMFTRHPMRSLGIFIFIMGFFFGYRNQGQQVTINEVTSDFDYTATTLTGVLQKDVPSNEIGNYFLVLDDGRYIMLNVNEIDSLLGKNVTVFGTISRPTQVGDLPYMLVERLQTN